MTSPVWSTRHLRSRVTHLLRSFSRCQHCIRRLSISPPATDPSLYLSAQLDPEDYQTVLSNPVYFVRDEGTAKCMERSDSKEWGLRGKLKTGKSGQTRRISPVSNVPEVCFKPKSAQKRHLTSEIEVRERRLIAARAFIRRITLPRLDNSGEKVDLRGRNVEKLWKSLANTSFKEAILTKSPPKVVFLSKIDHKRDKRQEKIDKNTDFLHELTLKRQQEASRKKGELEFQRFLQRKRLELRLEQKKGRKVED